MTHLADIPLSADRYPRSLIQSNGILYVAMDNILTIYDLTNPASPLKIAEKNMDGTTIMDMDIQNNILYMAIEADEDGIAAIDVSTPSSPGVFYTLTDGVGQTRGITVKGNYAYVVNLNARLVIVDISDFTKMEVKASITQHGSKGNAVIKDSHVFWPFFISGDTLSTGVAYADITDPVNPGAVSTVLTTPGTYSGANGIDVVGGFLFVAHRSGGLVTIDISDMTNIGTPVYSSVGSQDAYRVMVHKDVAYLTLQHGIGLFKVIDPSNPGPMNSYANRYGIDMAFYGDYFYAMFIDGKGSLLKIYDISCNDDSRSFDW
jgi:hypothetical protein